MDRPEDEGIQTQMEMYGDELIVVMGAFKAQATFQYSKERVVCSFFCGETRTGQVISAKLFEEYQAPTEAFGKKLKDILEKRHEPSDGNGASTD